MDRGSPDALQACLYAMDAEMAVLSYLQHHSLPLSPALPVPDFMLARLGSQLAPGRRDRLAATHSTSVTRAGLAPSMPPEAAASQYSEPSLAQGRQGLLGSEALSRQQSWPLGQGMRHGGPRALTSLQGPHARASPESMAHLAAQQVQQIHDVLSGGGMPL